MSGTQQATIVAALPSTGVGAATYTVVNGQLALTLTILALVFLLGAIMIASGIRLGVNERALKHEGRLDD